VSFSAAVSITDTDGVIVQTACCTADHQGAPTACNEIDEVVWLTYADRPRVSPVDQFVFDYLHHAGLLH
jgi:8-oxo-dGTP diphosphatase